MKDRLLARLKSQKGSPFSIASEKSQKGFTLIELLVVIAIIAVLVVIVVVAINPVQRLNDAADREAASNVRSAGTLISTCITQELATGGAPDSCIAPGGTPDAVLAGYGNTPTSVATVSTVAAVDAGGSICAFQEGSSSNFYIYSSLRGEVGPPAGTAPDAAACAAI